MAEEIPTRDWMQWFLGASEEALIQSKGQFIDATGTHLRHQATGVERPTGSFECPSVAELQEQVDALPTSRADDLPCELKVVDGIDIGSYQATFSTEDKAMVQIASNFHCLENGNPRCPADCGHLVTGYASDGTQGPAASFGVPAASLLRAHFPFRDSNTSPEVWGQTKDRQVNLIADISSDVNNFCGSCINGKAILTGSEKAVDADKVTEVSRLVKVGLHSDAEVVFSRGSCPGYISVVREPQRVDQVCSSTLCLGFADRDHNPPPQDLENLLRVLLRAAYEGAYLAAIKRERKVLLLTLIGGACFGNPIELIVSELKRAHDLYSTHLASHLREVRLVLYEKNAADRHAQMLNRVPVSETGSTAATFSKGTDRCSLQ